MTEKAGLVVIVGLPLFIGSTQGSNEASNRGNIQLLMTLTHLFSRVFWCLSVTLYSQNCKHLYGNEGTFFYQDVVIHLLLQISKAKTGNVKAFCCCVIGIKWQ